MNNKEAMIAALSNNINNFNAFKVIHESRYEQVLKAMEEYGNYRYDIGTAQILKAMEEYGNYRYDIGTAVGYTAGIMDNEERLMPLVNAQKQLISLNDKLAETDFLTKEEWIRKEELRQQIKELQENETN